jgi:DNA-directed RNA polymerase specialized sigma24 family protein
MKISRTHQSFLALDCFFRQIESVVVLLDRLRRAAKLSHEELSPPCKFHGPGFANSLSVAVPEGVSTLRYTALWAPMRPNPDRCAQIHREYLLAFFCSPPKNPRANRERLFCAQENHGGRMAGSVISLVHGATGAAIGKPAKRWSLDRQAFNALLTALDPDLECASGKYTALHDRLIRFFQWNNVEDADALADETLDRLARRVAADRNDATAEAVKEPEKFAAGIARLLLHEYWRQRQRQEQALQLLSKQERASGAADIQETEALAQALDHCLQKLPAAQRELIEKYYGTEGRNHIESRKQLAGQLKISLNALRNRAMRIRSELEEHAAQALGVATTKKPSRAQQG